MGFWASGTDGAESTGSIKGLQSPDTLDATPNYDAHSKAILAAYAERKKRMAPLGVIASKAAYTAPSGVGAGYQSDAAAGLSAAAAGKGPSVAGSVMGAGVDDALRARMASAAGLRPGANTALASSATGGAAAAAMQGAAAKSALAKAQETQAATGQYGSLLGAMRSQDLGTAAEANKMGLVNAGFDQQADLFNQQQALQWQAMSDADKNAWLGMYQALNANEMGNRLNRYTFEQNGTLGANAQSMRDRAFRDAQWGQLVMGAGNASGYAAQAYAAGKGSDDGWGDYRNDLTRK